MKKRIVAMLLVLITSATAVWAWNEKELTKEEQEEIAEWHGKQLMVRIQRVGHAVADMAYDAGKAGMPKVLLHSEIEKIIEKTKTDAFTQVFEDYLHSTADRGLEYGEKGMSREQLHLEIDYFHERASEKMKQKSKND